MHQKMQIIEIEMKDASKDANAVMPELLGPGFHLSVCATQYTAATLDKVVQDVGSTSPL